jgi:hypothetical protein
MIVIVNCFCKFCSYRKLVDRINCAIKSNKFVCTTPSLSVEAVQKQFNQMTAEENKDDDDQAASKKTSTIFFFNKKPKLIDTL